jgi:hypothetical protein
MKTALFGLILASIFTTQALAVTWQTSLVGQVPPDTTAALLPTCSSAQTGAVYRVTNALTPALGVAVVGGGAVAVLVRCNGTAWLVGQ